MDRRQFVSTAGIVAGTAIASNVMASGKHDHHNHDKMVKKRKISKVEQALLDTTAHCATTGKICITHCLDNLAAGNTSMAECQQAVLAMLPVVDALHSNVSYNKASKKNLKMLAETCLSFCEACLKTCEPHVKHHKECADCAQSCKDCISAIKKYMAAM